MLAFEAIRVQFLFLQALPLLAQIEGSLKHSFSQFQALHLGLLSIWGLFLSIVFPAPLTEETLFFIVYSCLLCHRSGGHRWVGLSLDFLSCSFGQNLVCAHNHLNQAEELKVSPLLLMIQVASPPESLVFSSIK